MTRKKRGRPKNRKKPNKKQVPKPRRVRKDVDLITLWEERRAGARNIAGVSYQIAVTAQLLVNGPTGGPPIQAVTPEGIEDVDCELAPNAWNASRLFVQCKERAQGQPAVGLADFADFFAHALEAISAHNEPSRIALVTDAKLGSDLKQSGWNQSVLNVVAPEVVAKLRKSYFPELSDIEDLLARTHIVHMPFDPYGMVTLQIAEDFHLAPVVAGLVLTDLLKQLSTAAADQRLREESSPIRMTAGDLATLVSRIQRVADASQLLAAEAERIILPLDLLDPIALPPEDFLAGVDARPGHVAANLDIPRPVELGQISDGLLQSGIVLIVGPSGSGKSTLLWRSAAGLSGFLRPFRLYSCRGPNEVSKVIDYIDALVPSKSSPVLVCVDDLGREATAGWDELAGALLERQGVLLLGASREEDFTPSLAIRRAIIVIPKLDAAVARGINDVLEKRGVERRLSVDEAFAGSGALMMEFLSLLLSGERLKAVVAEQVAGLAGPESATGRAVLRYICSAHILGASLPATSLPALIDSDDLIQALDHLKREHFILESAHSWRGLHELRSEVIASVIHETPPPDQISTWAELIPHFSSDLRPLVASRVARTTDLDLGPVATTVGTFIDEAALPSTEAAALIRGLKQAESVRHAAACLKQIRSFGPPKMDIVDLLRVLAAKRFLDNDLLAATGKDIDPVFYRMADSLPDRPSLRDRALTALGTGNVVESATSGSPIGAARLLEAWEGSSFRLVEGQASAILASHASAPIRDRAPLIASLLANGADLSTLQPLLGDVSSRLTTFMDEEVVLREWHLRDDKEGKVASTTMVTIPQPDADPNGEAVAMARSVLDLCPEIDIAEIVLLGVDGKPYPSGGTDVFKRLTREALPREPQVDEMKGLMVAAHELTASAYWTQRLREQASLFSDLLPLLQDVAQRLLDPKDSGKQRWVDAVDRFRTNVANLPTAPLPGQLQVSASETDRRRGDPAREVLQDTAGALGQLAVELSNLPPHRMKGIAVQLRGALKELVRAYATGSPALADVGDPLPKEAGDALRDAADILIALADREVPDDLPSRGGRNLWLAWVEGFLSQVRNPLLEEERKVIESAMLSNGIDGEISLVAPPSDQLPSSQQVDGQWIIVVDVSAWDSGSFLNAIPDPIRESLVERLTALPTLGGQALPLGAARLGSKGVITLSSASIIEMAALVDLDVRLPPLYRRIVETIPDVMRASAWIAAGRIGIRKNLDESLRATALALVSDARQATKDSEIDEASQAWGELCDAVEEEIRGNRPDGLATQTAIVVRGGTPGDLVDVMQRALVNAAVAGP